MAKGKILGVFDKPKFANKDKVSMLRKQISDKQIFIDDLPKDVLENLLQCAIARIDRNENGGEGDERDFKDLWCDQEFIVDELFEELEKEVKAGCYE